jgi:hypothetical protein
MPAIAILQEVRHLRNISERLELLADQHVSMTDALLTISGSIRETATLLEVLVATKDGGSRPI